QLQRLRTWNRPAGFRGIGPLFPFPGRKVVAHSAAPRFRASRLRDLLLHRGHGGSKRTPVQARRIFPRAREREREPAETNVPWEQRPSDHASRSLGQRVADYLSSLGEERLTGFIHLPAR